MRPMRQEGTRGIRLSQRKKLVGTSLDVWVPQLIGDPVPPRPRVPSPLEREHLRNQTRAWLQQGVIEKTEPRPWVNNTVFVGKPNGDIRVCIDCTPSNIVTRDFDWPLPRLQDLRHHLTGARWFSRMDLSAAFFRIKVPRNWRPLVAYRCDGSDYWFKRMPFGLKTAPSVFQRYMDHILAPVRNFCFWYIDDVLVFGTTRESVRRRTAEVEKILTRAGNEVARHKSEYEKQGLLFAGMWIYASGVGPNHRKVTDALALPMPRTKEQKQSALGLVSYLRDHIPLASMLTAALTHGKDNTMNEEEYELEWNKLKRHIADRIATLGEWGQDDDADLFVDASKTGCGAILIQDGRIICLVSRKLTPPETRYSATDREQLGLLLAAKKMRVFLHRPLGTTRVWTDHAALLGRKTDDMTPRQTRWHETVTQWITRPMHVRGKNNPADFVSRWGLESVGGQIQV